MDGENEKPARKDSERIKVKNNYPKHPKPHKDAATKINNFKGKQNTNGFDKHPENAGRRRNRVLELIESQLGEPVEVEEIKELERVILNMSIANLQAIVDEQDKNKYPIFVVIMAANQLSSLKRGDMETSFKLLERVAGKAPQSIHVDTKVETRVMGLDKLTNEELEAYIALTAKLQGDNNGHNKL